LMCELRCDILSVETCGPLNHWTSRQPDV